MAGAGIARAPVFKWRFMSATADAILKTLIYDVVLKAVMTKIIARVPFLGFPVIVAVSSFVVTKIATAFYEELSKTVDFYIIDTRVEAQRVEYEKDLDALKTEVTKPVEQQDEAAIQRARDAVKEHLRSIIRFGHS